MSYYGELKIPNVTEDFLSRILSSTPEDIIALLVVMLDRQGVIDLDDVKHALDLFDREIPYPFICVKGGVNRYNEIIDLLRKGESVAVRDCKLPNIKKALRRAGIEAVTIELGRRYYLLRSSVARNE